MTRAARLVRTWVPPALVLAALIGVWEAWVVWRGTPAYVLPTPGRVASAIGPALPLMGPHMATTLEETLLGMVLGGLAGGLLATLIFTSPLARRALYPLTIAIQAVPIIVLSPLLAVSFGLGITPKVVVVVLIVFFPVLVNTVQAMDAVDPEYVDLVRSMGASPRRTFRTVLAPAAIPDFFVGLRIGGTYAMAGAIIGEYVGGNSGMGVFLDRSKTSFLIDRVYVGVLAIVLVSLALFALMVLLGRLAAPWAYRKPTSGETTS